MVVDFFARGCRDGPKRGTGWINLVPSAPDPFVCSRAEADIEDSDAGFGSRPQRAPTFGNIYRDPTKTPLKATVKPGENPFEFELDGSAR